MGNLQIVDHCNMFQVFLFAALVGLSRAGHPVCKTVWEEKCWPEPVERCTTVQKPYTTIEYEEKCTQVKVPKVESVPVKTCTQVPEESLKPLKKRNAQQSMSRCVKLTIKMSVE